MIDVAFADAIRQARAGFRGAELRRGAEGVSADLIAWLRSGRPLPDDAGETLALFFAGELAGGRGRPGVIDGDDFTAAARRAARAYSRHGAEVKAAAKTTSAALIEAMRSSPLNQIARSVLVEFIAGQMHPAGGKSWGARKNQDDRALAVAIAERKAQLREKGLNATVAEGDAVEALQTDPRAIRRKHSVLQKLLHTTSKARRAARRV